MESSTMLKDMLKFIRTLHTIDLDSAIYYSA